MRFVLTQWFSQPLTLPVLFTNFLFLAAGFSAAMAIRKKKTIIYIMLTMLAIFFLACAVTHIDIQMFRIYAVYVGALCLDACVGMALCLIYKRSLH